MPHLLAVALLALFAWFAYRLVYLHIRGIRTTATVVEVIRNESHEGAETFTPIVAFTTNQGTEIIAKSFYGTEDAGSRFKVGKTVDVLYSAKDPHYFTIVGYEVCALILLGLVIAGILGFVYSTKLFRKSDLPTRLSS
ncbi:DUF3592 domain-containing protein [Hymenobacter rubidus]|uniref:DUF3592 domain-containing protein n=1 Tax=Hymenobacter rubidus TaxID=1441626 RepID=UPI00191D3D3D|nr:DUF3592 domain-containing protein [Hymenobacter rubidus]